MIGAMGNLSAWGVGMFLLFGLLFLVSDDSTKYRKPVGIISLFWLVTAVVASTIRETYIP
jgi:hypothetical protein